MAIFDRLFGRHKEEPAPVASRQPGPRPATPTAALDDDSRISLQLLYPSDLSLDAFVLTKRLCAFHPAMNIATVEIDASTIRFGTPAGRAQWGGHVIEFAGSNSPMVSSVVESCIAPGKYDGAIKQQARNHQAQIRLSYTGSSPSAVERYVALTAVAGTLGSTGAVVVLNQNARASLPIEAILPSLMKGDRIEVLRKLPIPDLYAGFVELDISGQRGVWMRTYGCQYLHLPNLAMLASDRGQHNRIHGIFSRVFDRLLIDQHRLEAGATLSVASDICVAFRTPSPAEFFLHDPTEVFVVEEVNRSG